MSKAASSNSHETNGTPFISKNVLLFSSPLKVVETNTKAEEAGGDSAGIVFDLDHHASHKIEEEIALPNVQRQLTKLETLLKIFRTTTGKDKIAKLIKYILDLFSLVLTNANVRKLFQTKKAVKDLLRLPQLSFDPSKAIFESQATSIGKFKTVFFGNENFSTYLQKVAKQMAFFRHSLRFGWTYFNIVELFKQISAKKSLKKAVFQFNETDFLLLLELYYNVVDDLLYMHKLNIWDNSYLKDQLDKHDARSWYYQIIYSLKTAYFDYRDLTDIILKKEIKRDMLLENKDNLITQHDDVALLHELDELYQKLELVKLDLFRLSCDFLADSIDVFNLTVPRGSYALFSFASGIIGFRKLWLSSKYEKK